MYPIGTPSVVTIHSPTPEEDVQKSETAPLPPQKLLVIPPRPDAPPSSPRASSLQVALFSGAWKKANKDIVSEVAKHLAFPDRLALSQSKDALCQAMIEHNDIKVPDNVVEAWTTLQKAPNIRAMDTLLQHLPNANNLDKSSIAMEFVKYLINFQSESESKLEQLDHLYNALPDINVENPSIAMTLSEALFAYGIARLPQEKHTAGLERITNTLYEMAARPDELTTFGDLAAKREKSKALTNLITIASNKFSVMPLTGNDREAIGKKIVETFHLVQGGDWLHDFSLVNKRPDLKLPNQQAESVLNTMRALEDVQTKLGLARECIAHFNSFELKDAPKFISDLEEQVSSLQSCEEQHSAVGNLLNELKKLSSVLKTS